MFRLSLRFQSTTCFSAAPVVVECWRCNALLPLFMIVIVMKIVVCHRLVDSAAFCSDCHPSSLSAAESAPICFELGDGSYRSGAYQRLFSSEFVLPTTTYCDNIFYCTAIKIYGTNTTRGLCTATDGTGRETGSVGSSLLLLGITTPSEVYSVCCDNWYTCFYIMRGS